MKRVSCLWMILPAAVFLAQSAAAESASRPLESLEVLGPNYPRAFFFRSAEGFASNPRIAYPQWEKAFERLMGIEGKVLDEEIPGRSLRNIEAFTRFKQRHPNQLVLLHYNGNARDPRDASASFFAGHWVYYVGAKILSDIPATGGETDIRVERPQLFRVNMGRYQNANEDIGLCELDAAGKPDWSRSEQVQLVSVDLKQKMIRVRRGCYGTRPRAFSAGRAYAAAHATEGPWGKQSHLLWYYNHSTRCPRDSQGRTCTDVLVEDLARHFLPGGDLATFDGLEFDVLTHQRSGPKNRGLDCDADGEADNGFFNGVNEYGIGVVEFCRKLRARLGDQRLILADGMGPNNQRAFGLLNGIESEGWPHLNDHEARDWSGGLNRHFFWAQNGRAPVFNYINHKFIARGKESDLERRPDIPFNIHRLVFAVGMFTDSAICYSYTPEAEPGELLGIWDELKMGRDNKLGWLGQPKGPAVRLAQKHDDVLGGAGRQMTADFLTRWTGEGMEFSLDGRAVRITARDSQTPQLKFRLREVPCNGPDLVVFLTARAEPMKNYPREVARLAWAGAATTETPPVQFMTWLNDREFTSSFYFSQLQTPRVDLHFTIEGGEPVWVSEIAAYAHADAIVREFEHGVVLANPSPRPYAFDLERLFSGRSFRRLHGSPRQDPAANNGAPVAGRLELGPKDALFLVAR
ncbi:MAG: hypothetical protein N3D11_12460 [Candidatus Sumerlaeia bacterium]|nr:hypothetical protein [Candidatus Sumerlaeia bacterium]